MFVHKGSKVRAECPGRTRLWSWLAAEHTWALCQSHLRQRRWKLSPPGDFPVTQCAKWDFSAFHLLPQDAILELWVQQHLLACLHAVEKLYEQLISLPYRQLPSVRYSDLPFFQRAIIHLGPWCLTALILCVWKKIKLAPFPLCPFLMMISHSLKKLSNCFSTICSSVVQVPD